MAPFKRKTDNPTSIILSRTTYLATSGPLLLFGPIALAGLFTFANTTVLIGGKQQSVASSSGRGALVLNIGMT